MVDRQPWIEHTFQFDIDPGWAHNILPRVQDSVWRLEHHCRQLPEEVLSTKLNGLWSIKEHIGHLTDLESLFTLRMKEFGLRKPTLSGWDVTNAQTTNARHNEKSVETLILELQEARDELLRAFHALSQESMFYQALHPRLKVMMRPVDLLYFVAEHDDHHLASILEIKNKLLS